MRSPFRQTRSHAVARLRLELVQRSFPRLQMGLMVALTGAFGLLSSYLWLRAGVESMAVRYPLALAIPFVAIVLALGLAVASFYVVWLAPTLLAELMLDGVLSYALYRHFRGVERRHWLETAVRRTAWPLGMTAVFVSLLGAAMAAYAPGAHSLGDVIQHAPAATESQLKESSPRMNHQHDRGSPHT